MKQTAYAGHSCLLFFFCKKNRNFPKEFSFSLDFFIIMDAEQIKEAANLKKWFQGIKEKLAGSMKGRYGFDDLSMFLNMAGLILIFLAYIPYMRWLSIAAWAVLIWAVVRAMSRNHAKRREELNKYYGIKKKITDKFSLWKVMWKERKTHLFFKCKTCGAVLRVPKGRGEIIVTCPKCKSKIDKKT